MNFRELKARCQQHPSPFEGSQRETVPLSFPASRAAFFSFLHLQGHSISSSLSLHHLHFVLSSLIKSPCASLLRDTCDCILDPFSNLGKSYHLRILNYIEVTLTNSRNLEVVIFRGHYSA